MNLGELTSALEKIRVRITDRDPDSVEVVIMNPAAERASDICEKNFTLRLEEFQRFPAPVDPDKPEWHKQIRIQIPRK